MKKHETLPTAQKACKACSALLLIIGNYANCVYAGPAAKTLPGVQNLARALPKKSGFEVTVVSTGEKVELQQFLAAEKPTVFTFYKPSTTVQRDFVNKLQKEVGNKIGFGAIQLKTGSEPIVQQYQIQETPTALVFDRRGRLVGRSSNDEEIRSYIARATRVMRIDWAEEGDPRLNKVREMMGGRENVPDILRTMSLRPDYLQGFMAMSMRAQFTDGFIDRRTKELIATYVSAINKCRY